MKQKKSRKVCLSIISMAICLLILCVGFVYIEKPRESVAEIVGKTSIFSWEKEYIELQQEESVIRAMKALNCEAIYQEIPDDMEEEAVLDFLARRALAGQDVYYLAGAADWALKANAKKLSEAVEAADRWNKGAGRNGGFKGIVFDVEPYLLDEWDENKEACMKQYVDNMEKAYKAARKKGLLVIVCIPNFYDRAGVEEELKRLVETACDGIAVMNYNKTDEAGQIAFEVSLAEKYNKGIINIVELQQPGYHELTEAHTYYDDGIKAVFQSFRKLEKRFAYKNLGFSWHYLKPALELLERDGVS